MGELFFTQSALSLTQRARSHGRISREKRCGFSDERCIDILHLKSSSFFKVLVLFNFNKFEVGAVNYAKIIVVNKMLKSNFYKAFFLQSLLIIKQILILCG
jgi:hypothetical protein